MTHIEMIASQAKAIVELKRKQNELKATIEKQNKDIEYLKKVMCRPKYYSIVCFANKLNLEIGSERLKELGKKCVSLCKEKGYVTGNIEDPRFGYIRTYPHDVLEEIFSKKYGISFD